jgi:hypothetical protein
MLACGSFCRAAVSQQNTRQFNTDAEKGEHHAYPYVVRGEEYQRPPKKIIAKDKARRRRGFLIITTPSIT